jgi:hypothetical protein
MHTLQAVPACWPIQVACWPTWQKPGGGDQLASICQIRTGRETGLAESSPAHAGQFSPTQSRHQPCSKTHRIRHDATGLPQEFIQDGSSVAVAVSSPRVRWHRWCFTECENIRQGESASIPDAISREMAAPSGGPVLAETTMIETPISTPECCVCMYLERACKWSKSKVVGVQWRRWRRQGSLQDTRS